MAQPLSSIGYRQPGSPAAGANKGSIELPYDLIRLLDQGNDV